MQRMDISQVAPDLYKALLGVETYLRGSVEPATYELVKLRASITNGCLFCVDMHTNDAMKAGETTQRLFGLAAWRAAPWYTDAERDRKSVVEGKRVSVRVDIGGRSLMKKNKE